MTNAVDIKARVTASPHQSRIRLAEVMIKTLAAKDGCKHLETECTVNHVDGVKHEISVSGHGSVKFFMTNTQFRASGFRQLLGLFEQAKASGLLADEESFPIGVGKVARYDIQELLIHARSLASEEQSGQKSKAR